MAVHCDHEESYKRNMKTSQEIQSHNMLLQNKSPPEFIKVGGEVARYEMWSLDNHPRRSLCLGKNLVQSPYNSDKIRERTGKTWCFRELWKYRIAAVHWDHSTFLKATQNSTDLQRMSVKTDASVVKGHLEEEASEGKAIRAIGLWKTRNLEV